jgi:uncharacterized protein (DUF849 family)
MANDENLDEQVLSEITERFKQQVEALTPTEAKIAKQLLDERVSPKAPEPDFKNMNNSEFAAELAKAGVR